MATSRKLAAVAAPIPVAVAPAPLAALAAALNAAFPEREETIRAMLLAAVAGQHCVAYGPPGTGKSALVRQICEAFQAAGFETLMTRFSVPEEILGPVKLSGLQADRFSRQHKGYLPTAEVAFLDEVFKANSAILNSLLTIMNERVVHDDGAPVKVPLRVLYGASNELPEGPELDALEDRFMVRCHVDYLVEESSFRRLLRGGAPTIPATVRVDVVAEQAAARAVTITPDTEDAIVALWQACKAGGVRVSDRRWRECQTIVQAAAHLDGRTATTPDDLDALECVLWRKPEERSTIAQIVQTVVNPSGAQAVKELDMAKEIARKVPAKDGVARDVYMAALGDAITSCEQIAERLEKLPSGRKVDAARAGVAEIRDTLGRTAMAASGIKI